MRFVRGKNNTPDSQPVKVNRCRSLPHAKKFRLAVALCAIHYLCLMAMISTAVMLILHPGRTAAMLLIATTAATISTWFLALLKKRATLCPLCKGTPLIESGALLHERAKRLPPFTHGVSTTLSILVLQTFRCMYCGSDFDLLKESSQHRTHPKKTKRRRRSLKRDD